MKHNTGMLPRRKPVLRRAGQNDLLFFAAKTALLGFLAVYIGILFCAGTTKDVGIDQIRDVMRREPSVSALVPGDANTWKRSFSLQMDDYPDAVLYTADSMMDVSELLIVKTDDTARLDALDAAVRRHLEEQKNKFDGYGTNQTELLEHAVILEKGNYFFYGVSEQVERWEEVFLSCI